ncbi:SRPBCC family protein [Nocardioides pacificus]
MATYSFRDSWHLPHPVDSVARHLSDLEHYPRWWPQVVAVAGLGPDDALVLCRSVLPYTLELQLHAVHREPPVLETTIAGDLEGEVRFRLTEESGAGDGGQGGGTRVDFEQDVRVTGRLLGAASYVARPVLRWNHDRMMAGCLAGLRQRLAAQESMEDMSP